jgi:hypothetical protein
MSDKVMRRVPIDLGGNLTHHVFNVSPPFFNACQGAGTAPLLGK